MRDHADNVVIVCSIENIDPMGVHTGDSVTVAPQQTLTDRTYQKLRDQAIAVIRAVGVETGGSNVQFAVNPATDEIVVIEMNPRVSRSSALASKATGFPIAKIAARLAVGYTLDEIPNDITQATPARFEPTLDYVVVKWPRFAFEKFPGVDTTLSTHMKSVGEVMAIGRTFGQAFGKALRSRELDAQPSLEGSTRSCSRAWKARRRPLRRAARGSAARRPTARSAPAPASTPGSCASSAGARQARSRASAPTRRSTPARPSSRPRRRTTTRPGSARPTTRSDAATKPSVMILGSGPNRIGQGIEFDYCCVHAAMTVRESGRDAVMVNCNPETVSTDYDTSDRLYFEPLTLEDVLAIVEIEQPEGVIVQFGGQTPLRLAAGLRSRRRDAARHPASTRSTSPRTAGASARCSSGWAQGAAVRASPTPRGGAAAGRTSASRCSCARPTCSAGARWRSSTTRDGLADYFERTDADGARDLPRPLPRERDRGRRRRDLRRRGRLDRRHHAARRGGRHPLRRQRLRAAAAHPRHRDARRDPPGHEGIALALGVVGLINIQYAVYGDDLYVIEANPRASRTVPVRLQGDRPAARQAGLPGDARREARDLGLPEKPTTATSPSRRPCCRSTASPAPTRCSARRCARRAR